MRPGHFGSLASQGDVRAFAKALALALLIASSPACDRGPQGVMEPDARAHGGPFEAFSPVSAPARDAGVADESVEAFGRGVPGQPAICESKPSCQYPYDTVIVCGYYPGLPRRPNEWYMLDAINNKLRYYPEFASAVGIYCVRDCEDARAFMKAYAGYVRTHPYFDADQPLEPIPPPPPLPVACLRSLPLCSAR
jgi:hypothetical protein